MKIIFTTTIAILIAATTFTQAQNENGHFLIEFDSFSPPVKDIVMSLENSEAAPFLAPDILGDEIFLGDYKGKMVMLWFWSKDDGMSISQVDQLNLMQDKYRDLLQVIGFGDESKQELIDFNSGSPMDFPVIANGKVLGEAAFGGDLGLGRVILVDQNGVIQKVVPRETFELNRVGSFQHLEDLIKSK